MARPRSAGYLLQLQELRIADSEELEAGYQVTLRDPVPDPSKNSPSSSLVEEYLAEQNSAVKTADANSTLSCETATAETLEETAEHLQ